MAQLTLVSKPTIVNKPHTVSMDPVVEVPEQTLLITFYWIILVDQAAVVTIMYQNGSDTKSINKATFLCNFVLLN
jgi:hypothetical protein